MDKCDSCLRKCGLHQVRCFSRQKGVKNPTQKARQENKSTAPVGLAASLLRILEMNSKERLMLNGDEDMRNAPRMTR